ncbi:SRPBCC family protein [Sphingoaurantiacus capsulatus]|uniref:SRPBCC family protein n=1 Tax=Sphingoaurantiacus capsulatus TaxID=1771310 RepID=A0ABV7XB12_9SPHN
MRRLIAAALMIAALPAPLTAAAAPPIDVSTPIASDGVRMLVHEVVVPAPIADVWTAVSTAEGWRTWAVPLARELPDGRFETGYAPGPDASIEQQWIARTSPTLAAFRTTRTPKGFPHADAYLQVTSRFLLTPVDARTTRVRLEGRGYPAGPAGDALIGFFREGNRSSLEQLHARFVTGPIDWAARGAVAKEK